jgi:hypothetical protein
MRALQLVNECSDRAALPVTSEGGSEEPKVIVSIYHLIDANVKLSFTTHKFVQRQKFSGARIFPS